MRKSWFPLLTIYICVVSTLKKLLKCVKKSHVKFLNQPAICSLLIPLHLFRLWLYKMSRYSIFSVEYKALSTKTLLSLFYLIKIQYKRWTLTCLAWIYYLYTYKYISMPAASFTSSHKQSHIYTQSVQLKE